mgnify:CR=1 FL=1
MEGARFLLPPLHADDEGVLVFMRATFAKAELDSVFTVTADDASNFLAKRKLRTVGELRRLSSAETSIFLGARRELSNCNG